MKKSLTVLLSFALLVGVVAASPAEAGKKKKKKAAPAPIVRTVELPYSCPCGFSWGTEVPVVGSGVGFWLAGGTFGGGPLATGSEEKFVGVEVVDQLGQSVSVSLGQDVDGDGLSEEDLGAVCGKSDGPLEVVAPGSEVSAFVYEGLCMDGTTPSIATTGVIKFTFSNVPEGIPAS